MVCIYANGSEDAASENKESAATIDGHTLFFAILYINHDIIYRPWYYIQSMIIYINH